MSNEDFEELDRIEHTIRSIQNILAEALKEADEKGSQSNNEPNDAAANPATRVKEELKTENRSDAIRFIIRSYLEQMNKTNENRRQGRKQPPPVCSDAQSQHPGWRTTRC